MDRLGKLVGQGALECGPRLASCDQSSEIGEFGDDVRVAKLPENGGSGRYSIQNNTLTLRYNRGPTRNIFFFTTDDPANVDGIARFVAPMKNVEWVEVQPFHQLGAFKWKAMQLEYKHADTAPPTRDLVNRVIEQFRHLRHRRKASAQVLRERRPQLHDLTRRDQEAVQT